MKIILTENAEENLWQIYRFHADYSLDYANQFQADLSEFIFSNLSQHPKMGTLYNPATSVYRMVYDGRYNVYYVLKNALYIVYILDGRMQLNVSLSDQPSDLPPIS